MDIRVVTVELKRATDVITELTAAIKTTQALNMELLSEVAKLKEQLANCMESRD